MQSGVCRVELLILSECGERLVAFSLKKTKMVQIVPCLPFNLSLSDVCLSLNCMVEEQRNITLTVLAPLC